MRPAPPPHTRRTADSSGPPAPSGTSPHPPPADFAAVRTWPAGSRGSRPDRARAGLGWAASDRRGRPNPIVAPSGPRRAVHPFGGIGRRPRPITSASNASPTACNPSGIRAWISVTVLSISSGIDARLSRLLSCRSIRTILFLKRLLSCGVGWWLSEPRSLHHTGAASSIFN